MTASQFAARAGSVLRRRKQPSGLAADAGTAKPGQAQRGLAGKIAVVRYHWLMSVLMAAGLALRVLAEIGYRPALIYVDSLKYLYGASPGSEPLGYKVPLKLLVPFGGLGTVTAAQHLLGLAVAVALYALLLRRGASRWWAALAAAPVLLDAYQLQMEQMIMPDTWFEAMIVAGLLVLLWRPQITMRTAIAAGLILGASATVRQVGEILIIPLVLFLLIAVRDWFRFLRLTAALVVAFALPILGYCSFAYVRYGHFFLAHSQARIGRLVGAADCATLKLPAEVRLLCPTPAEQQALGPDALEKSGQSPLYSAPLPPGAHRAKLIHELGSAVEHQQPLRVAVSILEDSLRLFAPTRQPSSWVTPIQRWQFQTSYPTYPPWINICPALSAHSSALAAHDCMVAQKALVPQAGDQLLRRGGTIVVGAQYRAFGPFRAYPLNPSYGGSALVDKPVATFLHSYQLDGGYTPGPLLALFALAGLGGSVLALVRRPAASRTAAGDAAAGDDPAVGASARSGLQALACLLFTGTAAIVLFVPDVFEYSWRYELPAVVTLPPAGVLGICALLSYRKARREAVGQPPAAAEPAAPAEA
jgi:hypothetical protein